MSGLSVAFALASPAHADPEVVRLQSAGIIEAQLQEGRRVVHFEDSVVFDYAGYRLTAGEMTLDESIGRAWAQGGVRLYGPAGYASSSRVWLDLKTEQVVLEDLEAQMGPWSASARKAQIQGERIDLYDAVMTPCPAPNPLYSLHARRLSKESPTRFVARGVVPYFYFMPFFYLPRYTYELERVEEGDTLIPSRQGFEFNPGRGKFSGLFIKTTWRKKFFDKRLRSTFHFDYYSKPGPAVGEEIQYKTPSTDHQTFSYFSHQRKINRDGYSKAPGRLTRWRLWQTWNKKLPFGHFKSFINEASDSLVDDDYRFNLDDRRLREREINTELVWDIPNFRVKLLGERLKTLNIKTSEEYTVERRLLPAVHFLTFPVPIQRPQPPSASGKRGWRFYGFAEGIAGRGRDRFDRDDGQIGTGRLAGIASVPLASRLSATTQIGLRNEFRGKKVAGESVANTRIGSGRLTFHRPWWNEWVQTDAGYSRQKAWTNKAFYGSGGELENLLFASISNFRRRWKTSLSGGYDLRQTRRSLSTIDFQTGVGGRLGSVSSIVRFDPRADHFQSVYANGTLRIGSTVFASLGFQTVHTDSEIQIQFTPSAVFESKNKIYRYGFTGFYDAQTSRLRTLDFFLTRAFDCVETTLRISKHDSDIQFNFSFRLTGFDKGGDAVPDVFGNRR